MSDSLIHFLLVFDHSTAKLLRCEEFEDAERALSEYSLEERRHNRRSRVEVVLVGSDSIETVKRTHGNYFRAPGSLIERHLRSIGVLEPATN